MLCGGTVSKNGWTKQSKKDVRHCNATKFSNSLEAEKNIPDGLWNYDSPGSNNVENLLLTRQTRSTTVIHSRVFSRPQLIAALTLGFTVRATWFNPADKSLSKPLNTSFGKPIGGLHRGLYWNMHRPKWDILIWSSLRWWECGKKVNMQFEEVCLRFDFFSHFWWKWCVCAQETHSLSLVQAGYH